MAPNNELAVPHKEVGVAEFHKHISGQGLSEPRRMKQLLTWCGARALGDKPSYSDGDVSARQAGKPSRFTNSTNRRADYHSACHTRRVA